MTVADQVDGEMFDFQQRHYDRILHSPIVEPHPDGQLSILIIEG
jgi:hypothetical protein